MSEGTTSNLPEAKKMHKQCFICGEVRHKGTQCPQYGNLSISNMFLTMMEDRHYTKPDCQCVTTLRTYHWQIELT